MSSDPLARHPQQTAHPNAIKSLAFSSTLIRSIHAAPHGSCAILQAKICQCEGDLRALKSSRVSRLVRRPAWHSSTRRFLEGSALRRFVHHSRGGYGRDAFVVSNEQQEKLSEKRTSTPPRDLHSDWKKFAIDEMKAERLIDLTNLDEREETALSDTFAVTKKPTRVPQTFVIPSGYEPITTAESAAVWATWGSTSKVDTPSEAEQTTAERDIQSETDTWRSAARAIKDRHVKPSSSISLKDPLTASPVGVDQSQLANPWAAAAREMATGTRTDVLVHPPPTTSTSVPAIVTPTPSEVSNTTTKSTHPPVEPSPSSSSSSHTPTTTDPWRSTAQAISTTTSTTPTPALVPKRWSVPLASSKTPIPRDVDPSATRDFWVSSVKSLALPTTSFSSSPATVPSLWSLESSVAFVPSVLLSSSDTIPGPRDVDPSATRDFWVSSVKSLAMPTSSPPTMEPLESSTAPVLRDVDPSATRDFWVSSVKSLSLPSHNNYTPPPPPPPPLPSSHVTVPPNSQDANASTPTLTLNSSATVTPELPPLDPSSQRDFWKSPTSLSTLTTPTTTSLAPSEPAPLSELPPAVDPASYRDFWKSPTLSASTTKPFVRSSVSVPILSSSEATAVPIINPSQLPLPVDPASLRDFWKVPPHSAQMNPVPALSSSESAIVTSPLITNPSSELLPPVIDPASQRDFWRSAAQQLVTTSPTTPTASVIVVVPSPVDLPPVDHSSHRDFWKSAAHSVVVPAVPLSPNPVATGATSTAPTPVTVPHIAIATEESIALPEEHPSAPVSASAAVRFATVKGYEPISNQETARLWSTWTSASDAVSSSAETNDRVDNATGHGIDQSQVSSDGAMALHSTGQRQTEAVNEWKALASSLVVKSPSAPLKDITPEADLWREVARQASLSAPKTASNPAPLSLPSQQWQKEQQRASLTSLKENPGAWSAWTRTRLGFTPSNEMDETVTGRVTHRRTPMTEFEEESGQQIDYTASARLALKDSPVSLNGSMDLPQSLIAISDQQDLDSKQPQWVESSFPAKTESKYRFAEVHDLELKGVKTLEEVRLEREGFVDADKDPFVIVTVVVAAVLTLGAILLALLHPLL